MNTIISVEEPVFRRLVRIAQSRGSTCDAVANEILRQHIDDKKECSPEPRKRIVLPVKKGGLGQPLPGVNINSTAELLALDDQNAAG